MERNAPAHNVDLEESILAAIVYDPSGQDVFAKCFAIIEAKHFFVPHYVRIFEICCDLFEKKMLISATMLLSTVQTEKNAHSYGPILGKLGARLEPVDVSNVEFLCYELVEIWKTRELTSKAEEFVIKARHCEGRISFEETKKFFDKQEEIINDSKSIQEDKDHISEVLKSAIQGIIDNAKAGTRVTGQATGIYAYDELTSGLHPGEVTVIAARPAMGKTSFLMNVAINVASPYMLYPDLNWLSPIVRKGKPVFIFSLEMPKEQLTLRSVCSESGVEMNRLRSNSVTQLDWKKLEKSARFFNDLPIWIEDKPGKTIPELRASIKNYVRKSKEKGYGEEIGMIGIDYLQLMRVPGNRSRENEVSELSRSIKEIAKEFKCSVMLLSQLNRDVEKRVDKRPNMSDLRESGAIEQDADNIGFLYRDDYYNKNSRFKGISELIMSKQRNGRTDTILMRFTGETTRFDNLNRDEYKRIEGDLKDGNDCL